MRAHITAASGPARAESTTARRRSGRGLDWFDMVALSAFAAISLWVAALDVVQVVSHGQVWTGTDGVYIVDQMQYLAWIRDASHHILASNLFVLRDTVADYFQPAIAFSGGLVALGVAPWVALLVWKPIALLVAFWGARWYVRQSLPERWPRRAALVLALFFGAFSVVYGSPSVVGDLFLGFLSWGYTFGLLSLGTMLLALLFYDRARSSARPLGRNLAAAALLGALTGSLHPWQGELLVLVLIGAEAWAWRTTHHRPRRFVLPLVMLAASSAPLVYYVVLGVADPSWHLARIASKHSFPLYSIVLAVLPLALVALPAYRDRTASFLDGATRAWPLAALVIYVLATSGVSATPLHAFEGVSVPLAVLAVKGAQRLGIGRLPAAAAVATALVALVTVPSMVVELNLARKLVKPTAGNPNFIAGDEQHALRFLAHAPDPGGVFSRFYLGVVVPGATGRHTFVGDCIWSEPHCQTRAAIAYNIFNGTTPRRTARTEIVNSGARFVLTDCQTRPDMDRLLAPVTLSVAHFGCAAVYELTTMNPPTKDLADSPPDAALRAPGRQQRGVQSL